MAPETQRCGDCTQPAVPGQRCCEACRARRNAAVKRWRERNPEVDKQRQREYAKQRAARDPQFHRRRMAKQKYGLTLEEYDAILARGCAICGRHDKRMHMDHCHSTGKVRDALCEGCNHAIGSAQEDPVRLRAAADYLELHAASPAFRSAA